MKLKRYNSDDLNLDDNISLLIDNLDIVGDDAEIISSFKSQGNLIIVS